MLLDKIMVTHPLLAIFDSTDRWGHSNQEQNAIRGGMHPRVSIPFNNKCMMAEMMRMRGNM
jgi:hypothetical protein